MASKAKAGIKPKEKTLQVASKPDEDKASLLARTAIHPAVQAAVVITDYDKAYGNLELMALIDALK